MGSVFKARDPDMGRVVAVKTLTRINDPAARARFKREVRAAAALEHPLIVRVYDCALEGDSPFIVMEFVPGESLDKKLQRGRLPFSESLDILRETAIALDFAHGEGIVHRDVKPGNVMIGRNGRTQLADFGIARILDDDSTHVGVDPGTPKYMAPEVLQGVKAVAASDQYSLSVMAFLMFTGAWPFNSEHLMVLLNQVISQPAPAPTSVDPALPKPLDAVLLRALSKKPAERYPNCIEFVDALAQVFREGDNEVTAPNIIIGPAAGDIRENPKDGLKYVWIPPGSFQMGRSPGDKEGSRDEDPRHPVTISKSFWVGQTPVTVAAWTRFAQASGKSMPSAPRFNKDWTIDRQPIVNVSWEDAQDYCQWADLRLPTEAEWE